MSELSDDFEFRWVETTVAVAVTIMEGLNDKVKLLVSLESSTVNTQFSHEQHTQRLRLCFNGKQLLHIVITILMSCNTFITISAFCWQFN